MNSMTDGIYAFKRYMKYYLLALTLVIICKDIMFCSRTAESGLLDFFIGMKTQGR